VGFVYVNIIWTCSEEQSWLIIAALRNMRVSVENEPQYGPLFLGTTVTDSIKTNLDIIRDLGLLRTRLEIFDRHFVEVLLNFQSRA